MKAVEYRLPKEFDKSFIVFKEKGLFFPCPWHYHPEYEFVLVNKSTGRRMVGDHIGSFAAGDLVLMGPALPHVWVNDQKYFEEGNRAEVDAVVLHFMDNFIGENFLNLPETVGLKKVLRLSHRGLVITGNTRYRIANIMNEMVDQTGLRRLSSLFSIFDILANSSEYEPLASPTYMENTKEAYSDRFSKITEYVLRNFHREISLKEVADEANMATTTFCNFFKEHFRMTFVEYLNSIRIGHVCKLLSSQDKTIIEIAYECGFNNLANFNRQFKRLKGMTPKEYRKLLEAEPMSA